MIVKVAGGRRDGKSSFQKLGKYLTDGILQSGEAPDRSQWRDLTQYITKESVLDALGDDVEKTIAVELNKLLSLKSAASEMQAVARCNDRVKDPVYHYILSWPENERPSTEDIFKASRHTLKALGLEEHQYIIAIHSNTDNLHAHIGVNRVHPTTFKSASLSFAHATLHKAAREAEIEFGWSHDKGIFEVIEIDGAKHIVKASEADDPKIAALTGRTKEFEVWRGEESLVSWCRKEPAAALKTVLADPATSSWQDIHRTLAVYGLELRDSGGSGMKIFDRSEDVPEKAGQQLSVSASGAFRFMKRAELERRLGPFEQKALAAQNPAPEKTYKRDPKKRLESRLERKAVRDALYKRFKEHAAKIKKDRDIAHQVLEETHKNADKELYSEFKMMHQLRRASVSNDSSLSSAQKRILHRMNRQSMQRDKIILTKEISQSRHERRMLLPVVPVWRAWVEEQAQLGDEAAISALRGMIYQEGREANKNGRKAAEDTENAIKPASLIDTDPYIRTSQNLIWKVAKNGNVTYNFNNGEAGFSDEGHRLTFGRQIVGDEALMTSIRYAADKWGELHLTGGDAAFKERVLRMAVAHNVTVKNPELQALQSQLRALKGLSNTRGQGQAFEDATSLIRTRNANANISQPDAKRNAFTGPIVGENSAYIVQHVGGNDYIVHSKAAFKGELPGSGKAATISYKSGQASLQAKRTKERGRK